MRTDDPYQSEESCGALQHWRSDDHGLELDFARGVMRIEALAADILRVRFHPQGRFAPRREWDVTQALTTEAAEIFTDGARLGLRTAALQLELERDSGALRFLGADDQSFAEDLGGPRWRPMSIAETPGLATMPDGRLPEGAGETALFLDKRMQPGEGYFGFGQRTGRLNRRHRRLTNWTVDRSSPGHSRGNDNMYQAHPSFMAIRPGLAWGLFLHSTWYSAFDVGAERDDVLTLFTLGGELDYYLFAGPTPAAVVEQLTRLTGRPTPPPLWALGYHQSRWSYGDDATVQAIAREFRSRALPLDAIHLDIDYMRGFRVFTWDETRFPRPAETIARLKQQHIRTVVIIDPGVKNEQASGYAVADQGVAQDHFVKKPDGTLFTGYVWPGESLFPDFCRASTRRWWGEWHAGLLDIGVDGIWCDMNEPAIVDRPFRAPGVKDQPMALATVQGEGAAQALHAETHNLYGLLMAQATAEGMRRLRPGRRPWVLTRSAYTGVQRHAVTWMGDNSSWWEHLEMSLPQLCSMGLAGAPHAGVDIGGFYHNAWGELFARWMELGTFYPFMRGHTRSGSRAQEPWAFGAEVEAVARGAIELRYRLLPYLYTLAHLAWRDGQPMLRPLCYEFPDAARLYDLEDQVMCGPQLMVAPVLGPGVERRLVELPDGAWYNFWSGARVDPGPLIQAAPPGRIPLFVRAGAILTLGNLRQSTAEPLTELTLAVFPGRDAGWTLIEDDGESVDYEQGGVAETAISVAHDGDAVVVTIDKRRGPFQPSPRDVIVQLHLPTAPSVVERDGQRTADWHWDAARSCVRLRWPDDGQAHRIVAVNDMIRENPG